MNDILFVNVNGQRRKATKDELAQFEKDRAESAERESLIEAETAKKQADRESAMAKLSKLGLTADEIASLIP